MPTYNHRSAALKSRLSRQVLPSQPTLTETQRRQLCAPSNPNFSASDMAFVFLLAGSAAVLEVHRLIHRRGHGDGEDELERVKQRERSLKIVSPHRAMS